MYGIAIYLISLVTAVALAFVFVNNRTNNKNLLEPVQVLPLVRVAGGAFLLFWAYFADLWLLGYPEYHFAVRHLHLLLVVAYLIIVLGDYFIMLRLGRRKTCPKCYGRGKVGVQREVKDWWMDGPQKKTGWTSCDNCNGKGWVAG